MTRRVTPKQFRVLQILSKNKGSGIPVTWWKTTYVYKNLSNDFENRLLQVQSRTARSLFDSDLLVKKGEQWYLINPLVTNLDVSRYWVTVKYSDVTTPAL